MNTYFPARTGVLVNQLRATGLYPATGAPQFQLNGVAIKTNNASRGDLLGMISSKGIIYYTTDGTDPAIWDKPEQIAEYIFVDPSANKKVLVPRSDIGQDWLSGAPFDDSSWLSCSGAPGGIGYEAESGYESLISLDLTKDMYTGGDNPNTSCYIRIAFTVSQQQLDEVSSLSLRLRYDGGFAAYLNGIMVVGSNAPGSCTWNSISAANHEAINEETFDISNAKNLLKAGDNLLAIQGLNSGINSSDFIISAQLIASTGSQSDISPSAEMYSGQVPLDYSGQYSARTYLDGNWSALSSIYFLIPEDRQDIKITEIQYHPMGNDTLDESFLEFVELKNTGLSTLDLSGFRFSKGIDYIFPNNTRFAPGEFIVLSSDENSFIRKYGFSPFGQYSGKLDNGGEELLFTSRENDTICNFIFDDGSPWPTESDGQDYSLVPVVFNPPGKQTLASEWRHSFGKGGSPGEDDTIFIKTGNEIELAEKFSLSQNYPNPFNGNTYIQYSLPEFSSVEIKVYNITGQEVAILESGTNSKGKHVISWDGRDPIGNNLRPGVYFLRLEAVGKVTSWSQARKMLLME